VRLVEKSCRVTGLAESRHLVASHIKPWRNSSDLEKLDGSNGLLTSQHLRDQVLTKWHVNKAQEVGQFSSAQSSYLEYHRDVVFESTRPISS